MQEFLLPITGLLAVTSILATGSLREIPTECPSTDSPSRTVHLPHEYDCTKYYKCSNGKKHVQTCPEYRTGHRLCYDPDRQVCNWPWNVICWSQRVPCRLDHLIEPHPYNCDAYYECEDGKRALKRCNKGELFDHKLMTCLPEGQAKCNVYLDRCPNGEIFDSVLLPHECKCSAYYECVNGEFVERYCPYGEEFDVNLRDCVSAEEAVCSTDTTPSSPQCPPSGTVNISHKEDCSLYYECVDGVAKERKCDDGLSFVEEKGMCSWPPSIDCSPKFYSHLSNPAVSFILDRDNEIDDFECPPGESKEYAYLPHHCSCNKYYVCIGGKKILETCPDGMEFDYVRLTCDYPENTVCRSRNSTVTPWTKVASERECSANGNERLPHAYNCSLYYQCQNGVKDLRSCYDGHHFNEIIQTCDLPSNTNCAQGTTSTTTPTNLIDCPLLDCDGIVRLRNKGDCSMYYECRNGNKVPRSCPKGLYFDPNAEICDWPENVNCTLEKPCVTGENVHHECQCNLYYSCQNGQKVLERCPDGENFDYRKAKCDKAENVVCYSDKGGGDDDQCIGQCSSIDSTENLPHEDCRKYCTCVRGIGRAFDCPANKFYNSITQECDSPENVPNLKCDPFPCTPGSSSMLPHPCHCDRYFVCRNGSKYRQFCDDGLRFDYATRVCVEAEQARCFADEPIRETEDQKRCSLPCTSNKHSFESFGHEDCRKYCKCSNGRRKVYECPDGLYFDVDKRKCGWPETIKRLGCDPFACVRGSLNSLTMLPHECNCSLYYTCQNGTKSRQSCAEGYRFDYVERTCVKSDRVHCYRLPTGVEAIAAEDCIGSCPDVDSTNVEVLLPHEQCTKFCVCRYGAPYVVGCPDGLRYDELRGICTTPDSARCQRSDGVRD